jgi:hypothetical protein
MLSIAVANCILVVLIILILHFFIIRQLLPATKTTKTQLGQSVDKKCVMTTETFVNPSPATDALCAKMNANVKSDSDMASFKKQQDEMLKYVMGGDDDKSLDQFFRDNSVSADVQEGVVSCKLKSDDHQLPLTSTCNINVDKMVAPEFTVVAADCDLVQDKEHMLLAQYAEEKEMNGGSVEGLPGLLAFDNSDVNYEPYFP